MANKKSATESLALEKEIEFRCKVIKKRITSMQHNLKEHFGTETKEKWGIKFFDLIVDTINDNIERSTSTIEEMNKKETLDYRVNDLEALTRAISSLNRLEGDILSGIDKSFEQYFNPNSDKS